MSEIQPVPETVAPAAENLGLWSAVVASIRGRTPSFTEGPIGRAIVLLAVPMILEMSMESIFGVVDMFFVGRLGQDAVATVGLTESILTIVFAMAMGLGLATTAMVARRIGEKDPKGAAIAAVQALSVGVVVAAVTGLVGAAIAPQLLRLLGASPELVASGAGYTRVMLGGNATIVFLFLVNAIFRGAGDAVIAMESLWLANLVNIVLVPCLIRGIGPFPEMGLLGAAIGTNIGRGVGVVYQVAMLWRGRGRIVIERAHVALHGDIMLRLLRVALGGMFQYLLPTASWIGLMRIVATFGAPAIAGYTIAIRIIVFAILPSWGMSNAAATLVGQNLGAGKPDRAERSVWKAGFYNMLFLGAIAVVFISFAEKFVGVFTTDPAVAQVGVQCLRYVSYGYVFYAYGMVMVQAFNGAGDTVTPTIINLCCYWLWQIPLAYGLSTIAGLGPKGVFLAITISESTIAVVGILCLRRGRWKGQRI
ncbi:MAG: MATE family efflux transporter [Planctomycetes bacterium]|nr:MATE family efflux transporter [Planctomycetota bacterium]